jgi:hypothetical protein
VAQSAHTLGCFDWDGIVGRIEIGHKYVGCFDWDGIVGRIEIGHKYEESGAAESGKEI